MRVVAIVGGNGNLGTKIAGHFQNLGKQWAVKILDDYDGFWQGQKKSPVDNQGRAMAPGAAVQYIQCDPLSMDQLRTALDGVDSVIHLAAQQPYPHATWEDSKKSLEMTTNVAKVAAQTSSVRSLVFTSSNHVMGGYLAQENIALDPYATAPRAGTRFILPPDFKTDSTPYAVAKLKGEAVCKAIAETEGLNSIAIRIGWCQPGVNMPETMSPTGSPHDAMPEEDGVDTEESFDDPVQVLRWFRNMWLSNRDLGQLMQRCVEHDPSGYLVLNGVSNNTGMRWTKNHWETIGYHPEDDVSDHL